MFFSKIAQCETRYKKSLFSNSFLRAEAISLALIAAVALTSCGGSGHSDGAGSASPTPSSERVAHSNEWYHEGASDDVSIERQTDLDSFQNPESIDQWIYNPFVSPRFTGEGLAALEHACAQTTPARWDRELHQCRCPQGQVFVVKNRTPQCLAPEQSPLGQPRIADSTSEPLFMGWLYNYLVVPFNLLGLTGRDFFTPTGSSGFLIYEPEPQALESVRVQLGTGSPELQRAYALFRQRYRTVDSNTLSVESVSDAGCLEYCVVKMPLTSTTGPSSALSAFLERTYILGQGISERITVRTSTGVVREALTLTDQRYVSAVFHFNPSTRIFVNGSVEVRDRHGRLLGEESLEPLSLPITDETPLTDGLIRTRPCPAPGDFPNADFGFHRRYSPYCLDLNTRSPLRGRRIIVMDGDLPLAPEECNRRYGFWLQNLSSQFFIVAPAGNESWLDGQRLKCPQNALRQRENIVIVGSNSRLSPHRPNRTSNFGADAVDMFAAPLTQTGSTSSAALGVALSVAAHWTNQPWSAVKQALMASCAVPESAPRMPAACGGVFNAEQFETQWRNR